MSRSLRLLIVLLSILIIAQHLPAPIVEEKPTPTSASAHKPKEKKSLKSKATTQLKQASKATPEQKASIKQRLFAGTWIGTIPAFPTGPQETRLTIDASETIMHHEWVGHSPQNDARTEIVGNTLRAAFHEAIPFTFSLTPLGDGTTAQVRLQAFMNDQTAIFHRAALPASAR